MSKSKSKGAAWREAGAATKPGGGLAIASDWPVHEVLLSRGWPVKDIILIHSDIFLRNYVARQSYLMRRQRIVHVNFSGRTAPMFRGISASTKVLS